MKITTVERGGHKLKMQSDAFAYLKICKSDYLADSAGMSEGGEQLSSEFADYVDFTKLDAFDKGANPPADLTENRFKKFVEFYDL